MRPLILPLIGTCLALAACDRPDSDAPSPTASREAADPLLSRDMPPGQPLPAGAADDVPRPVMQAQVVLDRLGFSPGVVDGTDSVAMSNALRGFQEANGLPTTGQLDEATRAGLARWSNIPATRMVTIPAGFAAGPFVPVPEGAEQQARMTALGYGSLAEKLAERFHTSIATLAALNPGLAVQPSAAPDSPATPAATAMPAFAAGQSIRVPNVGADRIDPAQVTDGGWQATLAMLGVGTAQPRVSRVVVGKSRGTLSAYDGEGQLVARFTVTTGSEHDPLPLGEWEIPGVAYNPRFHYDPDLFWDVPDSEEERQLPPGPNNPVGVVWIDLSKPHYGIHGTPEPESIGRAESHGCVRMTNWDAARLALMVRPGTTVLFEA